MSDINKYNQWISNIFSKVPFSSPFDFKEKEQNIFMQSAYMLDRTQSMFRWSGLPKTIPERILELYLQINGFCAFTEYKDSLYIFTGGLGGKQDEYYRPTVFTVANPALNFSANLKIGDECVIIPNDFMYMGLMPLINKYASMSAENELSIWIAIINSRIIDIISAADDDTKESAEIFMQRIVDGEFKVIADPSFLENDGIRAQPYGNAGHSNSITQLLESNQYLKASLFNDLGLNANYNMKREALSTAESQLNDDALLPFVDNMLRCREIAAEEINKKYGLEISVKLNSAWEDNQQEIDAEQKSLDESKGSDPNKESPEEPEEKEE